MKAPITLAIDAIIAEHVAPELKKSGFRKKGQRFWKEKGALIHLVEVERWKYNEGCVGKLRVSVAVYSPAVWELLEQLRPDWGDGFNPFPPPVQNCLFEEAVLPLTGSIDAYWEVDATGNVDRHGSEIAAALVTSGLTWLDQYQSLNNCRSRLFELSNKESWIHSTYLFCLAVLNEDADLCLEQLQRVLANSNTLGFPESERRAFREMALAVEGRAHASLQAVRPD